MAKKAIALVIWLGVASLFLAHALAETPSAEDLFERALAAEQSGDTAKAIDLLNQAAERDPRNGAILNNRAVLYATGGQYELALRDLDLAVKLNPTDPAVYVNRGSVLQRKGDASEAFRDYGHALEINPEHVPALLHRASLAAATQQGDAAEDLNVVLKLDPRNVMAHLMLGRLKLAKGQPKEALKSFRSASLEDPDNVAVIGGIAEALLITRDYQGSVEAYGRALKKAGQKAELLSGRCLACLGMGRAEDALKDCDAAAKSNPSSPESQFNLGNALIAVGRPQEAIKAFSAAVELKPDKPDYLHNRGVAHLRLGEWDQAQADFDRALDLNPRYQLAWNGRGSVLWRKGDLKGATECFRRAADLATDGTALKNLAATCLANCRPGDALPLLEKASKVTPRDPEVFIGLGDAFVAQNRFDRAVAVYKKALDRSDTEEERVRTHLRMGAAWERSGNAKKALAGYAAALEASSDPGTRNSISAKIEEIAAGSKLR